MPYLANSKDFDLLVNIEVAQHSQANKLACPHWSNRIMESQSVRITMRVAKLMDVDHALGISTARC